MGNCCLRKQVQDPNQSIQVFNVSPGVYEVRVSQPNTRRRISAPSKGITHVRTSNVSPVIMRKANHGNRLWLRPRDNSSVTSNTNIAKPRDGDKRQGKYSVKSSRSSDIGTFERVNKEEAVVVTSEIGYNNSYKPRCFCYGVLKNATQNFSKKNCIGEGGFGDVYKGFFTHCTMNASKPDEGLALAVKRLVDCRPQGHEAWQAEVDILGQLDHPNVVKLIGSCNQGQHRILVYEYMDKGSLDKYLFKENRKSLNWCRRIQIATGAAKGLAYLHTREKPIIHRDIKASNVLLDSNFNAKIADFGLAKYATKDGNDYFITRVIGTKGYFAPEYFRTGLLSVKADVYSFGVVLLEILSGSCVDKRRSKVMEGDLVERAKPLLCKSKPELRRVIDKELEKTVPMEEARKYAELTYQCLSQEPKNRPTMNEVVAGLEQLQQNVASTGAHHNFPRVARFTACPPPSSKKYSGKYGCKKDAM